MGRLDFHCSGGGGGCHSLRVAARLGLTLSEVDYTTFEPPKRKVKQVIKRDSDWLTIKRRFLERYKILFHFGSCHSSSQIHQIGDDQNKAQIKNLIWTYKIKNC